MPARSTTPRQNATSDPGLRARCFLTPDLVGLIRRSERDAMLRYGYW